jgi:hypothetical protein
LKKPDSNSIIYLVFEGYSDGDVLIKENKSSVSASKLATGHLSLTMKIIKENIRNQQTKFPQLSI